MKIILIVDAAALGGTGTEVSMHGFLTVAETTVLERALKAGVDVWENDPLGTMPARPEREEALKALFIAYPGAFRAYRCLEDGKPGEIVAERGWAFWNGAQV